MTHFADKLLEKIQKKGPIVVGIDPNPTLIPSCFENSLSKFCATVIDATCDLVPAVKFQSAYFEQYGTKGILALRDAMAYARSKNLIVINDVKRGDIGSTSQAYADAYLGATDLACDAITVNPFLGDDSIRPFVDTCNKNGKGLFILVKTSNPGASMIQGGISERLADWVSGLGEIGKQGYSNIGAVVGATFGEAQGLRKRMPKAIILVPGLGFQGGSIDAAKANLNPDGRGAIFPISRAITYPAEKNLNLEQYVESVRSTTSSFIEKFLIV